jgi:hypothetical protein
MGFVKVSHCLIKNLTQIEPCLIIKFLPTQTQPMKGSEGCMGFMMKEKQALTREYAPRYRQALNRKEKTEILDEYIRLTGYHRK